MWSGIFLVGKYLFRLSRLNSSLVGPSGGWRSLVTSFTNLDLKMKIIKGQHIYVVHMLASTVAHVKKKLVQTKNRGVAESESVTKIQIMGVTAFLSTTRGVGGSSKRIVALLPPPPSPPVYIGVFYFLKSRGRGDI